MRRRGPLAALRRHAVEKPDGTAFLELDRHGEIVETRDYAGLFARVLGLAATLRTVTAPGSAVAIPLGNSIAFAEAFLGCMEAGCLPVPLPPVTTRRSVERQSAILAAATPGAVIVNGTIPRSPVYQNLGAVDLRDIASAPPDAALEANASNPDPAAIAFVQFTSGTTGVPRGIAISHGALAANLSDIHDGLGLDPDCTAVSWLPPFHDMGLITAYLSPLTEGMTSVLVPTLHAIQRPGIWLRAISRYRRVMSFAPNFMYAACVDRISEAERAGLDLSEWRIAGCGSERVDPVTLARFAEAFRQQGLDPKALYSAYGLAEATLFVSGPIAGQGMRDVSVDPDALAAGRVVTRADGVRLTSCGAARGATRIRVVRPGTGDDANEGEVGVIRVAGPSLASGLWTTEGLYPLPGEMTDADGVREIDTGDIGFVLQGEIYPMTRHDDILINRGRKLVPDLLEATAIDAASGLQCAGAAAFRGDLSSGGFVVVLELARAVAAADANGLARRVRHQLAATEGATPDRVLVVKVGTLPRTTSGKISRRKCVNDYETGAWPSAASILDSDENPAS